MRIGVIGVGAIGGVVATQLLAAGVAVTLLVRRESQAEALREHGITLWQGNKVRSVAVGPVVTADRMMSDFPRQLDLILIATKNNLMPALAEAAFRHLSSSGVLLLMQNGLPEETAALILPRRVLMGGVVVWNSTQQNDTTFTLVQPGELVVGAAPGGPFGMVSEVVKALAPAGARGTQNLQGARWSKLAVNSVINTLAAVGGQPLGAVFAQPAARRLAIGVLREAWAVMTAQGIEAEPLRHTPALEMMVRLPIPVMHTLLLLLGLRYPLVRPSMLQDVLQNQGTEVGDLNGAIVRHGEAKDIPTPVNRALVARLKAIEAHECAPSLWAYTAIEAALPYGSRTLTTRSVAP